MKILIRWSKLNDYIQFICFVRLVEYGYSYILIGFYSLIGCRLLFVIFRLGREIIYFIKKQNENYDVY